jgi:hypothetical protein
MRTPVTTTGQKEPFEGNDDAPGVNRTQGLDGAGTQPHHRGTSSRFGSIVPRSRRMPTVTRASFTLPA